MPIKYGELTIIHKQEEYTLTNIFNWLTNWSPNKSTYIFLFEDGEICEYTYKSTEVEFDFELYGSSFKMPFYFHRKEDNHECEYRLYFYKNPDGYSTYNSLTDFNALFGNYSKYDEYCVNVISKYNSIYDCYKNLSKIVILGIVNIRSNESMPRFQFAYDSDEFSKKDIVCLIYKIMSWGE
jgi:hypothetical protein